MVTFVVLICRCGHCKNLAPTYEEVATQLKGEVNVAKVDASKERAIGSRFDIRGFPTILFLSHGQVYKYKGRRTKEALVEFASGGYKEKADEAEPIPAPKSAFQEFVSVFTKSYKAAVRDVTRGKYFTPNTLTVFMPAIFLVLMLASCACRSLPNLRLHTDAWQRDRHTPLRQQLKGLRKQTRLNKLSRNL